MRNATSPIKMMIIAVLFSVGLSGAAQATVIYLKCGATSTAVDLYKEKIVESSHFHKVTFSETKIVFEGTDPDGEVTQVKGSDFTYTVNRIDLSFYNKYDIKEGHCIMGRHF